MDTIEEIEEIEERLYRIHHLVTSVRRRINEGIWEADTYVPALLNMIIELAEGKTSREFLLKNTEESEDE
jgi:phosphate uptake regulator